MIHFDQQRLRVVFYRTAGGAEPVREWLQQLDRVDRKILGEDIKTVQWGWPLGMPLVRPLGDGLFELRSTLQDRTARALFVTHRGLLVLLHGFIKKTRKTPADAIDLARKRAADVRREVQG